MRVLLLSPSTLPIIQTNMCYLNDALPISPTRFSIDEKMKVAPPEKILPPLTEEMLQVFVALVAISTSPAELLPMTWPMLLIPPVAVAVLAARLTVIGPLKFAE